MGDAGAGSHEAGVTRPTLRDVHSLALHSTDVMLEPGNPDSALEGVGVVARRGVAKLFRGRDVVATMLFSGIEIIDANRFWRITGPDGTWTVRRNQACGCSGASNVWPA